MQQNASYVKQYANYEAFKMVFFHPLFLIHPLDMNRPTETTYTFRLVNEEINAKSVPDNIQPRKRHAWFLSPCYGFHDINVSN
jgi:hypothetical protein